MKKRLLNPVLILCLFIGSALTSFSQLCTYYVVGQVTQAGSGAPVTGQAVNLLLSNGVSYTAITNPNGAYNFSFSYPCQQAFSVVVSLQACGLTYSYTVNFASNTQTVQQNFSICGTPPPPQCPSYGINTWLVGTSGIGFSNTNQTATSYLWTMGDGTSYSWPQGSHTYQSPGTYTVCHQAVYSNTCVFDTCFVVTIPGNTCQLTAVVNATSSSPQTIQYSFTDSVNPSSQPVSVMWDMGDGYQTNNYPSGGSYTYQNPGTYNVCVTVAYANGCTATDCQSVTVGQNAGCSYILNGLLINGQTNTPVGNQTVTLTTPNGSFSAQSSPNGAFVITFLGPCNAAFTANVTVSACGAVNTYPLQVTPNNNTYSMTLQICGSTNPPDTCSVSPQIFGGSGNSVQFSWTGNSNQGAAVQSVTWDMGNGYVTTNYPNGGSYTYPTAGTYTACVTVTWTSGCSATGCTTITVGSTTTQNICGCVQFAGPNPAQPSNAGCGMAYLVQLSNANSATVVDSTVITPNGYCFNNVPAGSAFSVLAVPCASLMVSEGVLPTYLGNSIFWQNAIPATVNNYQANCISLVDNQNMQGPGVIGGTIIWGDDKAPGDPVPGVRVFILDVNNVPITMDITDAQGVYGFANLPYGTYLIYPEVTGYQTNAVWVTLSAEQPQFTYANFSLAFDVFTQVEEFGSSVINIYPNPGKGDVLFVQADFSEGGVVSVVMQDLAGRVLLSEKRSVEAGNQTIMISSDYLPSGFYTLSLLRDGRIIRIAKWIKQ
jgi:plastocyanin